MKNFKLEQDYVFFNTSTGRRISGEVVKVLETVVHVVTRNAIIKVRRSTKKGLYIIDDFSDLYDAVKMNYVLKNFQEKLKKYNKLFEEYESRIKNEKVWE